MFLISDLQFLYFNVVISLHKRNSTTFWLPYNRGNQGFLFSSFITRRKMFYFWIEKYQPFDAVTRLEFCFNTLFSMVFWALETCSRIRTTITKSI